MKKIVVAMILATTPALAADPINFTAQLTAYNGEAITQPKNDPTTCGKDDACLQARLPLTLGDVAVNALLAPTEDDRNLAGTKKLERDRLARRIYGNPKAALSAEDVSLIKERIGKVYPASIVGASWPLLDPTLDK